MARDDVGHREQNELSADEERASRQQVVTLAAGEAPELRVQMKHAAACIGATHGNPQETTPPCRCDGTPY